MNTRSDALPKPPSAAPAASKRAYWLKTLHQWHWISSALCLIGMLLFAFTGITLNHAADIPATPVVQSKTLELPAELKAALAVKDDEPDHAALPPELRAWLDRELGLSLPGTEAEWSPEEIYLSLPRPGGDAWLRIERDSGAVEYERTDRGWISYFNDLHKGRHTGIAWKWFLDVFSVACLVFCITGLFILKFHASARPTTWPMVGAGLVVPLLLVILFIH
ncbi:MAG TPA: PepSY-associated TM helix domain-containing protein [Hydrogenophaga sp.]|uniref:PepSY-associated TM helix domain-containing protein n=1 Tax=Hydrogenophaga sp. TaxID=1904254 RepID=UPI002CB1B7FF|nr:PepSY-associated TM helix domain-containing protein [Hydrogenophaga sp.]HSX91709.1 PepSY-associated TM helix domain-containing protein [Hydrogenophaga sp.]